MKNFNIFIFHTYNYFYKSKFIKYLLIGVLMKVYKSNLLFQNNNYIQMFSLYIYVIKGIETYFSAK